MTITTAEDFRRIGVQEGKQIAKGHSSAHMIFDPPNGPENVAYLEGVIQGVTTALMLASDTLTLNVTRELEAKEIAYMVFGTGALSYSWWGSVDWISVVDDEDFPIEDYSDLDIAEPDDVLVIQYDRAEDDEGTLKGRIRLTFRQLATAAGLAILRGYAYEKDAIQEDLGMLDAEQADAVLQLAVFGEVVYG